MAQDELLEQPAPDVTSEFASDIVKHLYGISGVTKPLESERDRNFLFTSEAGAFALKFANPAEGADVLSMQADALSHIADTDPSLPVPRTHPTIDGAPVGAWAIDGVKVPVRMVTFLPGHTLKQGVSSPQLQASISRNLARLGVALRGFFHPAAARVLLWDLSHLSTLRPQLRYLDRSQMSLVEQQFDRFDEYVAPRLPLLRTQVIHNDFNPENLLLAEEDTSDVTGIIDFGDMVQAPLIIDLAVAAAYQILGDEDPAEVIVEMASAYHKVVPLQAVELELLTDLVAGRLAQSLVISEWRASHHPENTEYILGYQETTWTALQRLAAVNDEQLTKRILEACEPPAVSSPSKAATAQLIERRNRRLGPWMKLSYSEPVQAVAADGVWITDSTGVRHLDAYNNVPHVGHSHPRVVAAIAEQSAVLNTNTRYLVESVVDYADRLVDLFPDDLSIVFFANSGSEANDLAWRIARTVTGNEGIIVTENAYHGSTYLTMATSPEEIGAFGLESWVSTIPAPDPRRIGDPGLERAIQDLAGRGHRPAALAFDTVFSSDGIFEAPPDYLRSQAAKVRDAGGLFIADEVQAGFGRVGSRFWGFADQGMVPDLVTLGKPMGNGHPIAAVVTTAAIAEDFVRRSYYFSTFGGNPVATAAALAVLDVLEDEDLPAKADRVGSYLKDGLRGLADQHSSITDVRGPGLFIGVEIAADGDTDRELATFIADEMRRRHILVGVTGTHRNVLKIRPPLAFDESHADLVLESLGDVLSLL